MCEAGAAKSPLDEGPPFKASRAKLPRAKLPRSMSDSCARASVCVVCVVTAMRLRLYASRAAVAKSARGSFGKRAVSVERAVSSEPAEIINESPSHRRRERPLLRLEDSWDGAALERDGRVRARRRRALRRRQDGSALARHSRPARDAARPVRRRRAPQAGRATARGARRRLFLARDAR